MEETKIHLKLTASKTFKNNALMMTPVRTVRIMGRWSPTRPEACPRGRPVPGAVMLPSCDDPPRTRDDDGLPPRYGRRTAATGSTAMSQSNMTMIHYTIYYAVIESHAYAGQNALRQTVRSRRVHRLV